MESDLRFLSVSSEKRIGYITIKAATVSGTIINTFYEIQMADGFPVRGGGGEGDRVGFDSHIKTQIND